MSQPENLGQFIKENKGLLSEYIETRMDLLKLQGIRTSSKAMGYFIWILISLFLLFIVLIFAGLVLGFWLSDLTGSFIKGFSFTTLIMVVLVALLAAMRKTLFVNPVIKAVIGRMQEDDDNDNDQ